MSHIKYWQAINEALVEEMERDERVVVVGEDVGKPGGTYVATRGLYDRFGPARVRDTPISEATLVGLATGAAMTGLRPVIEIMFLDFLPLAADQLINHAAKVSTVSGGAFEVPMVMRTMCGAGKNTGPQHGQSLESWVAHIPGLKVVWPSTPADAKGLLKAAICDPNPVVVIESLVLWGSRGEVDDEAPLVPLGTARVVTEGDDVTLVSWGGAMPRTIAAAHTLHTEHGIGAEVIDVRSLSPLDTNAILSSVAKTGRLVIVHDAVAPFGPGAEIAALAAGEGFRSLRAPVQRIAPPFAPVPFAPRLEEAYYPQAERVVEAAVEAVAA